MPDELIEGAVDAAAEAAGTAVGGLARGIGWTLWVGLDFLTDLLLLRWMWESPEKRRARRERRRRS